MDCLEIKNIIEIWKELETFTKNSVEDVDNLLNEQSVKLYVVYNNLLKSAQDSVSYNGNAVEKKKSKKEINKKMEQVGCSADLSFLQSAVPSICSTTKIQAKLDKMKIRNESTNICSSRTATRVSKKKELSTFVVNKKLKENINGIHLETKSMMKMKTSRNQIQKENQLAEINDKCNKNTEKILLKTRKDKMELFTDQKILAKNPNYLDSPYPKFKEWK